MTVEPSAKTVDARPRQQRTCGAMNALDTDFMRLGVCSVAIGALNIGDAEWKRLAEALAPTACQYWDVRRSRKGEPMVLGIAPLMTDEPLPSETEHPATRLVVDVIAREVVTRRIAELTGFERLRLRRCQAHMMAPGGFMLRHIDCEMNPLYDISLICGFEGASQGGTLIIETAGSTCSYDVSSGNVVIFRTKLPHEITRVVSGARRTLACWYSRSDDPNPRLRPEQPE